EMISELRSQTSKAERDRDAALARIAELEVAHEVLTHTRSCPALIPGNEEECTCGLLWRVQLQTEQTMHAAWEKRAYQGESERDAALARIVELEAALKEIKTYPDEAKEVPKSHRSDYLLSCVRHIASAALTPKEI